MRSALVLLVGAILVGLNVNSAMAQEIDKDPSFVRVGAGYYDVFDDEDAGAFQLEYVSGTRWWVFNPFAGLMATTDTALYAYAGIRLDVFLGNRFVISPSFAPGLYDDGNGKDLGFPVIFRSAIEVAYRFDDRSRLGLSLNHLSNGHLDEYNPGTEVLMLHYSYPFTRLFND